MLTIIFGSSLILFFIFGFAFLLSKDSYIENIALNCWLVVSSVFAINDIFIYTKSEHNQTIYKEYMYIKTLDKKSEIVQKEIIEINEKVIEIQNEDPICRPKEFKNLKLIEL